MAKVRLIDSQETEQPQGKNYKDIKRELEKRLSNAQSEAEFTDLVSRLNETLKAYPWAQKDKVSFRNLRQKIYDRKRKFQDMQEAGSSSIGSNDKPADMLYITELKPSRFEQDSSRQASRNHQDNGVSIETQKALDFLYFSKNLFAILMFGICTILTAWFVWKQSIPLYEAVGFPDPKFCAFGAILMILGFATIHSLTKSKVVLLLCLYASTYEVILIANGTLTHDSIQAQQSLENDTELLWLKEKAQHSEQSYQEIKGRFDDPTSNVFENAWYKQKYLTPAWEAYSVDKNHVLSKLNDLNTKSNVNKDSFLKILFRLGLVFLCMVSIHNFLKALDLKNLKVDSFLFPIHKKLSAK